MNSRNRIGLVVSVFPGIHYRKAQRISGLSHGTFRYHLEVLERNGRIAKESDGRYIRLYPTSIDPHERRVLGYLQHESIRRILFHLIQTPVITINSLAKDVGLSPSTVAYHLHRLRKAGLLIITKGKYDVSERDVVASLLSSYKSSLLNRIIDGFIRLLEMDT